MYLSLLSVTIVTIIAIILTMIYELQSSLIESLAYALDRYFNLVYTHSSLSVVGSVIIPYKKCFHQNILSLRKNFSTNIDKFKKNSPGLEN